MAAAASTAQEEFDTLVASKVRVSHHPDDISDDSDTLVDSAATTQKSKSKSSLRGGAAYDGADSSDADSDSEARLQRRRPSTYSLPRRYVYNANTGPKGVIADAQAFELEKGIGNKRTYVRTEAFVLPKNQRVAARKDLPADGDGDDEDWENDAGLDEEEVDNEEVMRKWRELRVGELKKGMLRRQSGGVRRGRYGTLQAVDAMGFLEAVENVPKETVVVVYVFDDKLPISDAYMLHITSLASKYPDIKFISLHFEEAEMEPAGIPAVLAYRDGEQFAGLIPLNNEVSFTRNVVTNMEVAFRSHGIL